MIVVARLLMGFGLLGFVAWRIVVFDRYMERVRRLEWLCGANEKEGGK